MWTWVKRSISSARLYRNPPPAASEPNTAQYMLPLINKYPPPGYNMNTQELYDSKALYQAGAQNVNIQKPSGPILNAAYRAAGFWTKFAFNTLNFIKWPFNWSRNFADPILNQAFGTDGDAVKFLWIFQLPRIVANRSTKFIGNTAVELFQILLTKCGFCCTRCGQQRCCCADEDTCGDTAKCLATAPYGVAEALDLIIEVIDDPRGTVRYAYEKNGLFGACVALLALGGNEVNMVLWIKILGLSTAPLNPVAMAAILLAISGSAEAIQHLMCGPELPRPAANAANLNPAVVVPAPPNSNAADAKRAPRAAPPPNDANEDAGPRDCPSMYASTDPNAVVVMQSGAQQKGPTVARKSHGSKKPDDHASAAAAAAAISPKAGAYLSHGDDKKAGDADEDAHSSEEESGLELFAATVKNLRRPGPNAANLKASAAASGAAADDTATAVKNALRAVRHETHIDVTPSVSEVQPHQPAPPGSGAGSPHARPQVAPTVGSIFHNPALHAGLAATAAAGTTTTATANPDAVTTISIQPPPNPAGGAANIAGANAGGAASAVAVTFSFVPGSVQRDKSPPESPAQSPTSAI